MREQLERYLPLEPPVGRAVDDAHPASPDQVLDAVAEGLRSDPSSSETGHVALLVEAVRLDRTRSTPGGSAGARATPRLADSVRTGVSPRRGRLRTRAASRRPARLTPVASEDTPLIRRRRAPRRGSRGAPIRPPPRDDDGPRRCSRGRGRRRSSTRRWFGKSECAAPRRTTRSEPWRRRRCCGRQVVREVGVARDELLAPAPGRWGRPRPRASTSPRSEGMCLQRHSVDLLVRGLACRLRRWRRRSTRTQRRERLGKSCWTSDFSDRSRSSPTGARSSSAADGRARCSRSCSAREPGRSDRPADRRPLGRRAAADRAEDGPDVRRGAAQGARRRRARDRVARLRAPRRRRRARPRPLRASGRDGASSEPAAPHLLREALALWRGPALAEFAYEAWAQTEIARLEELRLTALEDRFEADLATGRAPRSSASSRPLRASTRSATGSARS